MSIELSVESTEKRVRDLVPNYEDWLREPNQWLGGAEPREFLTGPPEGLKLLNQMLDQIEFPAVS